MVVVGKMLLASGIGRGWEQPLAWAVLPFVSLPCLLSSRFKCWLVLRNEIDPNITMGMRCSSERLGLLEYGGVANVTEP